MVTQQAGSPPAGSGSCLLLIWAVSVTSLLPGNSCSKPQRNLSFTCRILAEIVLSLSETACSISHTEQGIQGADAFSPDGWAACGVCVHGRLQNLGKARAPVLFEHQVHCISVLGDVLSGSL